jgi:hypothetical protein
MKVLDEKTKKTIRKLQVVLLKIQEGQQVFFNVVNYTKMGLIKGRDVYGKDSSGNRVKIRTDHYLTEKGKRIANTII